MAYNPRGRVRKPQGTGDEVTSSESAGLVEIQGCPSSVLVEFLEEEDVLAAAAALVKPACNLARWTLVAGSRGIPSTPGAHRLRVAPSSPGRCTQAALNAGVSAEHLSNLRAPLAYRNLVDTLKYFPDTACNHHSFLY
eukprot:1159487-Pelagomonas_calceolata.AAC.3